MKPLRIAQVAPLFERVPPRAYGGTERVVSYLTEELVRQGHDVVLYASGDSQTTAELREGSRSALRLATHYLNDLPYHLAMMESVLKEPGGFDVIHSHLDFIGFPFSRRTQTPFLNTLHGRLDLPELPHIYKEYRETPVVSISNAQRRPLVRAHWFGTVYHGLPQNLMHPGPGTGNYLAFLGRISPEKGIDQAIQIAHQAGMTLKVAAKIDPLDQEYFKTVAKPLMKTSGVEFVGEINEHEKEAFLGNASALLFPIDWPEPFGLVMIEAMACGTPVIAYRRGSVPEILKEGVTGYIVNDAAAAVQAVEQARALNRQTIREEFEQRFTAARMARDYVALFQKLIDPLRSVPPGQPSVSTKIHL